MKYSDIIVIGSGPGGMEVAAGALRCGQSVTIIERDRLGGTCLNRGCIPTKALCRSAEVIRNVADASEFGITVDTFSLDYGKALARKDKIVDTLRDNVALMLSKAEIVTGEARFVGVDKVEVNGEFYSAPKIVIATGSTPASLPIPGASLAIDSDTLLSATELPDSIAIIGGGVIGMEFACILAAFGVVLSAINADNQ